MIDKLDKDFLKEVDENLRKSGLVGKYDLNAHKNDSYFRDVVTNRLLKTIAQVINDSTTPADEKPAMTAAQLESMMSVVVYSIFEGFTTPFPKNIRKDILRSMIVEHCAKLMIMRDS